MSPITSVTVFATIAQVYIVTRRPIDKGKSLFQLVTTTFLSSAKVPASLSLISIPRKQYPVTTDYMFPIVDIIVPVFR